MREKNSVALYRVIKAVILEVLEVDEEKVSINAKFGADLDADSLDVVEILMQLEDKYSIEIPEETARDLKTVRQMVEYIEQRLQEK
ncbi:MAG: acyl carrier protein [Syntrophomonadales bacterium]|jgi:acyl carrier protein